MNKFILSLLILLFYCPDLVGCSLRNTKSIHISYEKEVKEQSKNADAVFVGKVIERKTIQEMVNDKTANYQKHYHLIRVSTIYKGKVAKYIEYVRPTSCHQIFDKGKEYLFFGKLTPDNELVFSSHGGTQELNMALALGAFKHLNPPIAENGEDLLFDYRKQK